MTAEPFLGENKPIARQFRSPRRAAVRPVVVVHTSESAPAWRVDDLAWFIQRRSGHGSYHLIGDRSGGRLQLVDYGDEAFHDGSGSNRWSIGISLVMKAAEWETLPPSPWATALTRTAAAMAADVGEYLETLGLALDPVRLLDGPASEAPGASGFIAHGDREPSSWRTDPGAGFPWEQFLAEYILEMERRALSTPPTPTAEMGEVHEWQVALQAAGYPIGAAQPDGEFGPVTLRSSLEALAAAGGWSQVVGIVDEIESE